MKSFVWTLSCLLVLLPGSAVAALRVFSCEPEWAALVTELAGAHADVVTATTAHQDPHYIQARPSLIAQMRRADLVVCTGAGLEAGWLPVLQRRAGNPRVQPGTDGYFEAASHVPMLDVPERLDRAQGDVHPKGNPHIHLDPHNIARVAQPLSERLVKLDPANAADYRQRLEDFTRRWQAAIQRWDMQAQALHGMPIVVHHKSWVYLNHWLGLQEIGALEPKPGVPPTSGHLGDLLATLQATPAQAVIRSPYQDARPSEWLSKQVPGLAMIEMPYTVGGSAQATDLFGLFDAGIDLLLGARK